MTNQEDENQEEGTPCACTCCCLAITIPTCILIGIILGTLATITLSQ